MRAEDTKLGDFGISRNEEKVMERDFCHRCFCTEEVCHRHRNGVALARSDRRRTGKLNHHYRPAVTTRRLPNTSHIISPSNTFSAVARRALEMTERVPASWSADGSWPVISANALVEPPAPTRLHFSGFQWITG